MNVFDVIIILAYFVGMIVLGLIANKKQTGVDDYYLGGRSMGAFKIGALWMAGWIGGSSVIGTSSNSYSMGITGVWYVGAIAVGCVIFALVMAKPVKRASEVLRNITFPELICARYDQKKQHHGQHHDHPRHDRLHGGAVRRRSLDPERAHGLEPGPVLHPRGRGHRVLCLDGRPARRDVYRHRADGAAAARHCRLAVPLVGAQLHKMGANLVTDLPASFFDLGAWGWPTILALGLSTIMSFFTSMDSYTRCIAARDAKTARTGTIYAAVLVFIIAGASTFLGMAGRLVLPDLPSSNNVIAALVVELFPHGLKGLVLIGVLSAIMSTADISVLTGSASLTKDIYQRYINPNVSEKTLLHVGLGASLLVGVLGAIFRLVHAGYHEHPAHHVHHQLGRSVPADARRVLLEEVVLGGCVRVHALGDGHRRCLVYRRESQHAAAVFRRRALAQLRRVGHFVCRHLPDAPSDPGGAGKGGEILRGEVSRKAPIPR